MGHILKVIFSKTNVIIYCIIFAFFIAHDLWRQRLSGRPVTEGGGAVLNSFYSGSTFISLARTRKSQILSSPVQTAQGISG